MGMTYGWLLLLKTTFSQHSSKQFLIWLLKQFPHFFATTASQRVFHLLQEDSEAALHLHTANIRRHLPLLCPTCASLEASASVLHEAIKYVAHTPCAWSLISRGQTSTSANGYLSNGNLSGGDPLPQWTAVKRTSISRLLHILATLFFLKKNKFYKTCSRSASETMITNHQKYFNLFLQLGVQGLTGSSGRSSTGRAGGGLGRSGGWADRPLQGHGESWLVSNSLKWGICNSVLAVDCKLQTKLLWTCFGPPFLPRSGKHLFEYFYLFFFFLLGEGMIFWLSSCSSVIVTTWETLFFFFFFILQLFKFTFHSLVPGHRSTVKAQHTQEQRSVGVVLVQLEVGLMDLQWLYNIQDGWHSIGLEKNCLLKMDRAQKLLVYLVFSMCSFEQTKPRYISFFGYLTFYLSCNTSQGFQRMHLAKVVKRIRYSSSDTFAISPQFGKLLE